MDHEAIPTFSSARPAPSARPARETLLPTDCADVLSAEQMAALLAQPIEGVSAHALIGQPAPSVGQLERVTCQYQRISGAGGGGVTPASQSTSPDVVIILTAYGNGEQARDQQATNVDAERAGARSVTNLSVGSAPAVLFDEGNQDVLMVTTGRSAVSVTLRRGVVATPDPRGVLVDLAQRVMPVLPAEGTASPSESAPPGAPTATGVGEASVSGTAVGTGRLPGRSR